MESDARYPAIDAATQLCAVIGNPVAHSLSPAMHNAAYRARGLNWAYLAFQVRDVPAFLTGLRSMPSFRGASVTIPHKIAVLPHLDAVDPMASTVGCANTITNAGGRLIGSVTDGTGTLRAFGDAGIPLEGQRVLFLGAGGAARAVAFAMALEAGVASITLLGRTPERVAALAEDLRRTATPPVATGNFRDDLVDALERHDVVINATPLGMAPEHEAQSLVPAELLRPAHTVFDMVYRPRKTRLIQEAEAAGARVLLGEEMLLHQAVLQFEAWTGEPAPVAAMRDALQRELAPEHALGTGAR